MRIVSYIFTVLHFCFEFHGESLLTVVTCMLTRGKQGLDDGRRSDAIGLFAWTARSTQRPICLHGRKTEYGMHLVELALSGEPAQFNHGPAE